MDTSLWDDFKLVVLYSQRDLLVSGIRQPYGYAGSNKYSQYLIAKLRQAGAKLYIEKSRYEDADGSSDYIRAYKRSPMHQSPDGSPVFDRDAPFFAWRVSSHMVEGGGYAGTGIAEGASRFWDINPAKYSPDPERGVWGKQYHDMLMAELDGSVAMFANWKTPDKPSKPSLPSTLATATTVSMAPPVRKKVFVRRKEVT